MTSTSHQNWIVVYETPYPKRARLLVTLLRAGGLEAETLRRVRRKTTGLRVPPTLVARARELLSSYSASLDNPGQQ
ncbi:MAG: hypothetical protein J4A00_10915 [Gammaproteobacteria bacterium]|nr:hypothetical protein [Gammaproteobacteria bacterium]